MKIRKPNIKVNMVKMSYFKVLGFIRQSTKAGPQAGTPALMPELLPQG